MMNHTAEKSLKWCTLLEVLTGVTTDISILLCFLFWDIFYVPCYKTAQYHGQVGSQNLHEIRGVLVGLSWNVRHALIFKILTKDTHKVIKHSQVQLAKDGENSFTPDVDTGKTPECIYICSKHDSEGNVTLPTIDTTDSLFLVDESPPPIGASKRT